MGNNLVIPKKCKFEKCPEFCSVYNRHYCYFHQGKKSVIIKKGKETYISNNSPETLDKLVECINDIYEKLDDINVKIENPLAPGWDYVDSDLNSE